MLPFDPTRPCRMFDPPARRRERRRPAALLFVEQDGCRFVVKSFDEPGDTAGDGDRRLARERDGIAAFHRAGAGALAPVLDAGHPLDLDVGGRRATLARAMVFAFRTEPTLYDRIAQDADAAPLLAEAGRRIRARHDAASTPSAIHSDGSAHNVFADWTWFDFCEPHAGSGLAELKAMEILRFVASVVEVSSAPSTRSRVAAFCDGYADREALLAARDHAGAGTNRMRARFWARMLARPDKLVALWRGDTRQLRRVRTWDALDHALRPRGGGATSPAS